jgi:hypothetical protein
VPQSYEQASARRGLPNGAHQDTRRLPRLLDCLRPFAGMARIELNATEYCDETYAAGRCSNGVADCQWARLRICSPRHCIDPGRNRSALGPDLFQRRGQAPERGVHRATQTLGRVLPSSTSCWATIRPTSPRRPGSISARVIGSHTQACYRAKSIAELKTRSLRASKNSMPSPSSSVGTSSTSV